MMSPPLEELALSAVVSTLMAQESVLGPLEEQGALLTAETSL